ncbi:uncharacterized protein [Dysidea avara]|uniref:uncharacterized protein isoform X2 n=1 Tax=Dysidea avara TaxID=196820 RepID=UPI00332137E7
MFIIHHPTCQRELLLYPLHSGLNQTVQHRDTSYYDGTDIGRPVIVDNSTGVPQYEYIEVDGYHPPSNKSKRAATAYKHRLWPKGKVYFEFHSSLTDAEKEVIYDAMRHWEAKTCIRFCQGCTPDGCIRYFRGPGCCSYVGRISGYIQPVSIGQYCEFPQTVHEIGHALGFWHEQSRPDRDEYIKVHPNNILAGRVHNFNKETTSSVDSLGVTYDFNSIMHYSAYAFSKSRSVKTMTSKEPNIPLGRSSGLSPLDIIQTQLLYKEQCKLRGSSTSQLPPKKTVTPVPQIVLPPNGKHLKGMNGRFSPPNYPQPYKSNTCYVWIIEVPEGYFISIQIFNIRIASPCNVNHVAVYSGTTDDRSILIREVCGTWARYRFWTGRHFAYIKFCTGPSANTRGYTGFSEISFEANDINECRYSYCDHNCTNLQGSYKCTCNDGYYLDRDGKSCLDVNECGNSNGGCAQKCVNTAGSHRCECSNGQIGCYGGQLCSSNNGGCDHNCADRTSGPVCTCNSGYELQSDKKSCRDINECNTNRGICGAGGTCVNRAGSYTCRCNRGYQLRNKKCQDTNECSNPTSCGANSKCVNLPGTYRCDCNSGYILKSGQCRDINECADPTSCDSTNQRCINLLGSFRCECNSGYRQLRNGRCEDINECSDRSQCSDPSKKCVNLPGTFRCECKDGYKQLQNRNCEDIDECTTNPSVCKKNEKCVNKPGGYSCQCKQGYRKNDRGNCKDINECAEGTHKCEHKCVNTEGSHYCECSAGYEIKRRSCRDINECATGNHTCEQKCVNTEGSYSCECRSGYELRRDKRTCRDINECRTGNHSCEQKCVNTDGSYHCECESGYELRRRSCRDIDECKVQEHNNCSQICTNLPGSYQCECNKGYQLRRDQKSCRDINECTTGLHDCEHICVNKRGSYECECQDGYEPGRNKSTCKDIDECKRGLHKCSDQSTCMNTLGSYKCVSADCSPGYRDTKDGCKDINECEGDHGCAHECVNTLGSYKCTCRPGYRLGGNDKRCKDNDECLTNNGGCDHICTNTKGSYQCSCNTSYVLAADNMKCNLDSCGYITKDLSGSIATNGYPNSLYAPHSNCTWVIDLPRRYKSIELKFDGLFIEQSVDCVKDKVIILNGKNTDSLPLGSYCGSQLPATVHSSTGDVTVRFTSDGANNKKGFKLRYRGLEERVTGLFDCDIVITDEGTFGPTTFPSKYIDPMACQYRIVAPSRKQRVKLTFLYVDVHDSECYLDNVSVYSGRQATIDKRLTQFCNGSHGNTVVTSTGSRMVVVFFGNTPKKYRGFHASVQFLQ